MGQRQNEAGAEAGSLADAIGGQFGTILNGLGIVVVEVLVDTELTRHVVLVEEWRTPQSSHNE